MSEDDVLNQDSELLERGEEYLDQLGEILADLFLAEQPGEDEPTEFDVLQDSLTKLENAGFEGVTPEDLQAAIEQLSESMTAQQQAQLEPLREAIANQPEPVIQQIIQQVEAPAAEPVTVVRHVTQVTEVTNVTNIDEGDQFVDQSVNTTILAEGDVDFDQEVSNTANVGDDGAVIIGGDAEDAAINTGNFEGVQGGGDVSIEDSAIGDGNVLVNDSEFDALAIGGDATNVEAGGDANVGSGTQVSVEAEGDANAIVGDANELTGDQTANIGVAPAPEPAFEEPAIDDAAVALENEVLDQVAEEAPIELDA